MIPSKLKDLTTGKEVLICVSDENHAIRQEAYTYFRKFDLARLFFVLLFLFGTVSLPTSSTSPHPPLIVQRSYKVGEADTGEKREPQGTAEVVDGAGYGIDENDVRNPFTSLFVPRMLNPS
jgi:hypothetical protein